MLSLSNTSDSSLLFLRLNSKSLIVMRILLLVFENFIAEINSSDTKYSKIDAKNTGDELVTIT
jgi:hypothetical protein